MRRFYGFPLLLLLIQTGLCTHHANATDKPDCARPFTLALHDHGLLYSASNNSGIDRDVANELVKRSGCKINISVMPRSRIWKLLEAGALDFSLSGITNPEREKYASFAWYFADKYSLLVRKDSKVEKIDDFEAATSLKLGAILSFRYSPTVNQLVDKLDKNERVIYTANYETLYKNLALNRIQGIIVEPFDDPSLDEHKVRELVEVVDVNDIPIPHGLIMSKQTISVTQENKWRALMEDMRADGTVLRIFEKYFKRDLARAMVNF